MEFFYSPGWDVLFKLISLGTISYKSCICMGLISRWIAIHVEKFVPRRNNFLASN